MTTVCVLTMAVIAQLPPVDPPPAPRFDRAVNYVDWYRAQSEFAHDGNVVEVYADFLYKDGVQPADDLLKQAGYAVGHQLTAISKEFIPWAPTQYLELGKWTQKIQQRYLPVFEAAKDKPFYAPRMDPKWRRLRDVTIGHLKNGTVIGRGLLAEVWRITGKIQYAQKYETALLANFTLTDHYCQGLTADEQMIATGQRAFLYEQIRYGCPNPLVLKRHWKQIAAFIENADAAPITACYARGMYWEQALAYEDLARLFATGESGGKPRFNQSAWEALTRENPRLARLPVDVVDDLRKSNPNDLKRLIDDYFKGYRAILESGDGRSLRQRLTQIDENTVHASPALRAFLSSQKLGVISAFRTEALRRAVHVYLKALVMFHETGKWPQSIDALAGADLAVCRIDPFTGGDLRFRMVRGTLLVYSVGPDEKDDGASEFSDVVLVTRSARR